MSLVADICDTQIAPREGKPLTSNNIGMH